MSRHKGGDSDEEEAPEYELCTVRKDSEAERLCKQLVMVILCSFSTNLLAITMNAIMTFPERKSFLPKELAQKMSIDTKSVKTSLSELKKGYYICEAQRTIKQAKIKGRIGIPKQAVYYYDFSYFIMVITFNFFF